MKFLFTPREKKIKTLWFLPLEANSAASLIFYTFFLNLAHCEPLQGKHVDGNKSYKKLVTNTLIPPCLLKLFSKNSWIWRWLWKKYLVFNEAEEYLFKWSYLVFQTKIVNQEHGNVRKFHWQNYVDGSCIKCRDMNLPMYFFFKK